MRKEALIIFLLFFTISFAQVYYDRGTDKVYTFSVSKGSNIFYFKIFKNFTYIPPFNFTIYGKSGECVSCYSCSYTPSCPSCSCTSPYTGGGIASCYSCYYTPSCSENCACPSPGSGGGIKDYKSTYTCSYDYDQGIGCGSSASVSILYPTCNSGFTDEGSSLSFYDYSSASIYCTSTYYFTASVQAYLSQVYSCSGGLCGNACSGTYVPQCVQGPGSTSKTQTCSYSPPSSITCYCSFTAYSDSACSLGVSTADCYSVGMGCGYGYTSYRKCSAITSTSCPSVDPCTGEEYVSCSATCNSCYSCSYTPSPPCSCTSPYTGGGCASCYSCSYTPSPPDCTCPSPGSGGGCSNYDLNNPRVDVFNDNNIEYSYSGDFLGQTAVVNINETDFFNWLNTCNPDDNGYCYLIVNITVDNSGSFEIKNINILAKTEKKDDVKESIIDKLSKSVIKTVNITQNFIEELSRNVIITRILQKILSIFSIFKFGYVNIIQIGTYNAIPCKNWDFEAYCKKYCPDCKYEIGKKGLVFRDLVLKNIGELEIKEGYKELPIPPESLFNQVNVTYNDQYQNIEVNYDENKVRVYFSNFLPGEERTYRVWTNISAINYNTIERFERLEYYLTINVSGKSFTLFDVFVALPIDERLSIKDIYIRGGPSILDNSLYGPPKTYDTNNNGKPDLLTFKIPRIDENSYVEIVVYGIMMKVYCEVINKTVKHAIAGENLIFLWNVSCVNEYPVGLDYKEPIHLPLESSNAKVDGIPKEMHFSSFPPIGPYIYVEGSAPANSKTYHIVEFIGPPVTVLVSAPKYPEKFYVGHLANLIVDIDVKNWIGEFVPAVRKQIPITYGENLKLYYNDKLIDEKKVVRGSYDLDIFDLKPYESRKYLISFQIPVGNATWKQYYRKLIDSTQYLIYPFEVRSLSPYPLDDVRIRFKIKNYRCSDVYKIFETSDPMGKNNLREIEFYCVNDEIVDALLGSFNLGEIKYFSVWVKEKVYATAFTEWLYNFIEWIINIVMNLINFLKSLL
ncbi:MAG: hypothetical protein ACP5G1_01570 [Nanopusillaceae archaeon]